MDYLTKTAYNTYKLPIKSTTRDGENSSETIEFSGSNVQTLSKICIEIICKNYFAGILDHRITDYHRNRICDNLDIELPLDKVFDLNGDFYWKRVVFSKVPKIFLPTTRIEDVNWKNWGVEVKFVEIIENMKYEDWDDNNMKSLAKLVAPFMKCLQIRCLHPMQENIVERNTDLNEFKVYHYPAKVTHHGSLEFIGLLTNLTELSLELQPPNLHFEYHRKFFEFSYYDIDNLGRGLKKLENLEILKITRTKLDKKKLNTILTSIQVHLKNLELSFCNLQDDCGSILSDFLKNNGNIKELDIQGNYLLKNSAYALGDALAEYTKTLMYFCIARNPLGDDGFEAIVSGIAKCRSIINLNISAIEITQKSIPMLMELVMETMNIQKAEIYSNPIGKEYGEILCNLLEKNSTILELDYRHCDLALDQELKIKIFLKRNKFHHQNPCLRSRIKTKEQEDEVQSWLSKTKNPIFLKARKRFENIQTKKQDELKLKIFENPISMNKPAHIVEEDDKKQPLMVHFSDTLKD